MNTTSKFDQVLDAVELLPPGQASRFDCGDSPAVGCKKENIVAAIDALLPVLESACMRPQMYFIPLEPATVETWLHGITVAYRLLKIDCPSSCREQVLVERRLEYTTMGEVPQLKERGLAPAQIMQELLSIEIDMWQAYRAQLTRITNANP